MGNASHPIWSLLRLIVLMVALCVILWANASDFDATEIRTLFCYCLAAAGFEGATAYIRGRRSDKQ